MVSAERIKTNKCLMKAFNLEDFLDPSKLTHEELAYYNLLSRSFDKTINTYLEWLDTEEAQQLFYEDIQYNEQLFKDVNINEIINDTSISANKIIEKIYEKGLDKGYKDIKRRYVLNEPAERGLIFLKDYNFQLIKNVNNDLADTIRGHIAHGVAEGQSMHEVQQTILSTSSESLKDKTLSAYDRASMIARTETARAMCQGSLQAYANYGVNEVKILTAGDDNVCPICREAETKTFSITDGTELVPFHPCCRCSVTAHIKDLTDLPDEPLNDVDLITFAPTNKENNDKNLYQTADEEYADLLKDSSVKCSKGHKLKSYTRRYKSVETFYKYEFEDITIYKSELLEGIPVKEILKYYRDIGYDKIKNSCKEIVLSNEIVHDEYGEPVGGYVNKEKNDRIYLLNTKKGLTLEEAKHNLYHEIGHCFDKNHKFSEDQDFRDSHYRDYEKMSDPNRKFTVPQKCLSKYVYKLLKRLKDNYENLSEEDRLILINIIYADLFAESIRELLFKNNFAQDLHNYKYEYIDSIL